MFVTLFGGFDDPRSCTHNRKVLHTVTRVIGKVVIENNEHSDFHIHGMLHWRAYTLSAGHAACFARSQHRHVWLVVCCTARTRGACRGHARLWAGQQEKADQKACASYILCLKPALNNLGKIHGDLRIQNNVGLKEVDGMLKLKQVDGTITITGNAALETIRGFEALEVLGYGIVIKNNAKLVQ